MTTIPRNRTKVIAALKTQYPYAVAHLKADDYTASVVEAQSAWDVLSGHRSAALTQQTDRLKITYPLGWFDLFTDADAQLVAPAASEWHPPGSDVAALISG